jgi:bile acid:Na+ symporter, BASS family
MKKNLFKALLIISVLLVISALSFYLLDINKFIGPALIGGLVFLALGVRGFEKFKGISYTLWIFTAVTASLFYPDPFISAGNFQLKLLIVPLLQIIMFGMGSQMSFADFTGVIKMPKGVFIGVALQFMVMPFIGFTIAAAFNFPDEIAAGIILIGCVPSGLASNVMSFLARANLPLAVTISAVTTLLSPFVTPLLMKWIGGQYIEVSFWSMMLDILNMIILPLVAGFTFNLFLKGKETRKTMIIQLVSYLIIILLTNLLFKQLRNADMAAFMVKTAKSLMWFLLLPALGAIVMKKAITGGDRLMTNILSMISMVGIAVIVTIITASGRDSLLQVGALLLLTSLIHNLSGYTLGYWLAWLLRMPERDRRTIAFEVGMQNGGLASGLALQMGKVATVGLAPAIFGPLMNVTGSILANYWRGKPVRGEGVRSEG